MAAVASGVVAWPRAVLLQPGSFPNESVRWFRPDQPSRRLDDLRRGSCCAVADLAGQAQPGAIISGHSPDLPPVTAPSGTRCFNRSGRSRALSGRELSFRARRSGSPCLAWGRRRAQFRQLRSSPRTAFIRRFGRLGSTPRSRPPCNPRRCESRRARGSVTGSPARFDVFRCGNRKTACPKQ